VISKQQIKHIRSLQQKKYRNYLNLFVIEGTKMVAEAIHQVPHNIEFICWTSQYMYQFGHEISSTPFEIIETSAEDFNKISSLTTPQQILAVVRKPENVNLSDITISDFCLALDGIRDPGNLGTIIRLADWFGIKHIVCSNDTVDCYNPKVIQSTMGAIFRTKIFYTEVAKWLSDIKQINDLTIYGTALNGENLYSSKLNMPSIVVLGNEAEGISKEIFQLTHKNLYIPNHSNFPDKTESLNVSIAAAVLCSEFRRQNNPIRNEMIQ
jgi:TrmH family RNA methyltransferase